MKNRLKYIVFLLTFSVLLTACGKKDASKENKKDATKHLENMATKEVSVHAYPITFTVPEDWSEDEQTNYDLQYENDYINFFVFGYHKNELEEGMTYEELFDTQTKEWKDKVGYQEMTQEKEKLETGNQNQILSLSFNSVYETDKGSTKFSNICYLIEFQSQPDYIACVLVNGDSEYIKDHRKLFDEIVTTAGCSGVMVETTEEKQPSKVELEDYGIVFELPGEYDMISQTGTGARCYSEVLACYAYGYNENDLENGESARDKFSGLLSGMEDTWEDASVIEEEQTQMIDEHEITTVLYEAKQGDNVTFEYLCLVEFLEDDRFVWFEFSGSDVDIQMNRNAIDDIINGVTLKNKDKEEE